MDMSSSNPSFDRLMDMEALELWEILVPDDPMKHQEWDEKVSKITGGISIQRKIKGRSICSTGLVSEYMIPVRVAVYTYDELLNVVDLTKEHYEQESVFVYKVSDEAYVI